MKTEKLTLLIALLCGSLLLSIGCRQDMHDQEKLEPFEAHTFFTDGKASRMLPANTVARGHLREDTEYYTGKVGTAYVAEFPMPVTQEVLRRGQNRFNIFCTPCHDRVGSGNGMIVQRGYKEAASFHEQRLRDSEPGYFYNVITEGFGVMPSYARQIKPEDRWAIAAYIRALQLSQNAAFAELGPEMEREVREAIEAAAHAEADETADGGHGEGHHGAH